MDTYAIMEINLVLLEEKLLGIYDDLKAAIEYIEYKNNGLQKTWPYNEDNIYTSHMSGGLVDYNARFYYVKQVPRVSD